MTKKLVSLHHSHTRDLVSCMLGKIHLLRVVQRDTLLVPLTNVRFDGWQVMNIVLIIKRQLLLSPKWTSCDFWLLQFVNVFYTNRGKECISSWWPRWRGLHAPSPRLHGPGLRCSIRSLLCRLSVEWGWSCHDRPVYSRSSHSISLSGWHDYHRYSVCSKWSSATIWHEASHSSLVFSWT